jgi:protein MpaA
VDSPLPVKDSLPATLDPGEIVARLAAAGRAMGCEVERFGEAAACPLVALTRRTPGPRPRIYLSAGIHGDEPAPPLALLEMLEAGVFDERAVWFICPLLNPAGFRRGARENAAGLDLNRDYRDTQSAEIRAHIAWLRRQPNFDLTLCVHEDWEAKGYYLYEQNPQGRPSLAGPMLAAASRACPIDPSELIDGREARGGIIHPAGDPWSRAQWPEAIYLRAHHTVLGYTIESPSALPLPRRIAAHRAALEAALDLTCGSPANPR